MDVISIHVLKTAGSTFGKYLSSVIYGPERVFLDYDDFVLNPEYPYSTDHEAWRISAEAQVRWAIGPRGPARCTVTPWSRSTRMSSPTLDGSRGSDIRSRG